MGNPKAPRRLAISDAERGRRDKETLLNRLRLLGLDDEGLRDLEEHWDDFDESWTPEFRYQLTRTSDARLLALIRGREDEYRYATTTEDDESLEARARAVAAAEPEAQDKLNGTIREVLAWVGDDPVRAMAARNLEANPEGASRVTLLDALDRILNGT